MRVCVYVVCDINWATIPVASHNRLAIRLPPSFEHVCEIFFHHRTLYHYHWIRRSEYLQTESIMLRGATMSSRSKRIEESTAPNKLKALPDLDEYTINYLLIFPAHAIRARSGWSIQSKRSIHSNFLLCSPAQQQLYTLAWKHKSLFHTTAGVLSSFLHPFLSLFLYFSFIPYLIPYLHFWAWLYSITMFLQKLYIQTSNWLLVCCCTPYIAVALYFHTKRLKEDRHKGLQ
jgi:hypothetical protein